MKLAADANIEGMQAPSNGMQPFYFLIDAIDPNAAKTYKTPQPTDLVENDERYFQLAAESRLPSTTDDIRIRVDANEPRLDCRGIMPYGKLCTDRFLGVMRRGNVSGISIPVTLVDFRTGRTLSERRFWWVAESVRGAIDLDRSEFTQRAAGRLLTKLVLRPDVVAGHPLFRPAGRAAYIAHEKLRDAMQAEKLSGVTFAPLDTAFDPFLGARLEVLGRDLAARPENPDGWYTAALWWWYLHRNQEALEAISRALPLRSPFPKAKRLHGQILRDLGRLDEALFAFEQSLREESLSEALADQAEVLLKLGRVDEASRSASAFQSSYPEAPRGHLVLAQTQIADGHFADAVETIDAGLGVMAGSVYRVDLLQLRAKALMELGRYNEALETNEEGLGRTSARALFLRGKAAALRALGHPVEADQAEDLADRSVAPDDYLMISRQR